MRDEDVVSVTGGSRTCAVVCAAVLLLGACGRKPAPEAAEHGPAPPAAPPTQAEPLATDEEPLTHAPSTPTNLRPVRVTVLEYGVPAAHAEVWIEHFSPTSSWWHACTRGDGRATLLVPMEFTWFRVSASKAPNAIAAQFVRGLPQRAEPFDVTLDMTNRGVVITALVEAPRPEVMSNLTVRIDPESDADWNDVSIARVPDAAGPRVVLPPIRAGLRGLRVKVMSPLLATCFSERFDTRDGCDKTISVQLIEGARVYGTARLADGSPAGTFTISGTPAGTHGLAAGAGVVRATLHTDAAGMYACSRFAADFYRLQAACQNMQTIRTNVLVGDDGTQLDLVFQPQRIMTVRGRVLVERTQQPAADVIVQLHSQRTSSATTDVTGAFAMQIPYEGEFYGDVRISHAGYAEVSCYLQRQYQGEELLFLLRDTALISGAITYEDGTPASNVTVSVSAYTDHRSGPRRARVAFGEYHDSWQRMPRYEYRSHTPSDAGGAYVISNVAAPETYQFGVGGASSRLLNPKEDMPGVRVTPGAAGRCDLVVQRTPCVFVKVCDAQGTVLRAYDLLVEYDVTEGDNSWSGSTTQRARPDADGWQRMANWGLRDAATRVSLRATTPDGAVAETNHLRFAHSGTHYVTLIAVSNASRGICGYVYDAENEPLVDVFISASHGERRGGSAQTDHLGFFELPGSGAQTSVMVRLHAWYNQWLYRTNVLESTEPVIWVLDPGRMVSGRVCIEHAGQPATNFAVGLDMYNREAVAATDGRFTLRIHDGQPASGLVCAWVAEYAPATKPYTLPPRGDTDVGDIIVPASAGTVRGRVINERGAPVRATVSLHARATGYYLPAAMTGESDGGYEFTRLPTGIYQAVAHKPGATSSAQSDWFSLAFGQTYTVPDLVICMTNAVFVRLVFVTADGTPAAHMQVSHVQQATDAHGAVEEYVSIGRQEHWTLYDNTGCYYAEPFEVTPGTRELRVMLAPNELIEGSVTVDGAPLPQGYLSLQGKQMQRSYGVQVRDGSFSCKAQPGTYYATCVQQSLVTTVDLVPGANNHIAFVSGDASLTVTLPAAGRWHGSLQLDMGGQKIDAGYRSALDTSTLEFQRVQAGAYTLRVFGELAEGTTNLQREVQLGRGQHADVRF